MSRSHTGRQYEPHIQDGESAETTRHFLYRRQGPICDRNLSPRSTRNMPVHGRQGGHPSSSRSEAVQQPDPDADERTDPHDRRPDVREVGAQQVIEFTNVDIRGTLDLADY